MSVAEIAQAFYGSMESELTEDFATYLDDEFTANGFGPQPILSAQFVEMMAQLRVAFPNWSFNVSKIEEDGNVAQVTFAPSGTHQERLELSPIGLSLIPATGKSFQLPVMQHEVTIIDERVVNLTTSASPDGGLPGILRQLGVA